MFIRESKMYRIANNDYLLRYDVAFTTKDGRKVKLKTYAVLESPDDIRRIRESARKALKQEFRRLKGKTLLFLPPVPDIPTTYINWRTGKVKP